VQSVRELSADTFVIRIDKHDFQALAGQHVTLGPHQFAINREFSIYSSPDKPFLEFLVRAPAGSETVLALQKAQPGDEVDLTGPYGKFLIKKPAERSRRYLFVATGVGIAPFHSFVTHYPELDYRLIHGIPNLKDRYDQDDYAAKCYVSFVSREEGGDFSGRVTEYLLENPADPESICYICRRCRLQSALCLTSPPTTKSASTVRKI